jgi:hypothetical protein
MLSLPVAPRFDRTRTAVRWLVGITSIANIAVSTGWAFYAWDPEPRVFTRGLTATVLGVLPEYVLSVVLLCLAVRSGRWSRQEASTSHEPAVPEPSPELELPEYLNG